MACILINTTIRNRSILQWRKRYKKLEPTESQVARRLIIRRLEQADLPTKSNVPWRFHLKRFSVNINRLRKRVRKSVFRGVGDSEAPLFQGQISEDYPYALECD
eukprot:Gb_23476 [translate_table: standard]